MVGVGGHPDSRLRGLRSFEVDLPSGSITAGDATVANLDGAGLPLNITDLSVRHTVLPGHRARLTDVAVDGSMAFATWPRADPDAAIYCVVDPAGQVSEVADTGTRIGYHSANYVGGMVFASPDEVWLARNDNAGEWIDQGTSLGLTEYIENIGSTWTIERHAREAGVWSHAETLATSTDKLVRPVVPNDRATGPRVLWHQISGGYGDARVWAGDSLDWDGNSPTL